MAANEDTLFGRLTKAIVDRVVGSMATRLQKLGQRISSGSQRESDSTAAPTGLVGRLVQRASAKPTSDSGRQAWLLREPKRPTPVPVPQDNMITRYTAKDFNAGRHKRWVEEHAAWQASEPKRAVASQSRSRRAVVAASLSASQASGTVSPSANPTLLDRVLGTMQRTSTGAKRILDSAIMKAESWITSAPQRMRATLTAPSAKRKGPRSTPGARRLRTKRVRGVMLGRAKQAWGQIKSVRAAQRNGSIPYDRGQLEKQSLSSIVSAEKSKQSRAAWLERTVNERGQVVTRGRLVNMAKRTGLDFFAKRQNRTRAAGLVKRAKVRLNNARRRVAKASGAATPQMRAAVTSAAGRLAKAQGMLAKTTMLASGSLGQLAKTGVGAITALHAFPYAMKKLGESRVEQLREASQYSSRLMTAMARYDIQDRQLTMRGAVNTSGSASRTVDATAGLKESLQGPLENLSTITNAGVEAAVFAGTVLNEIMKAWNPLMIGMKAAADAIEDNTDKEEDKPVTAMDFFKTVNDANNRTKPMKALPPIK